MEFPKLSLPRLLERLEPPKGKVQMVLDTDTYNEIDDQFAVVQCLLSPEDLEVEAIYAAPFANSRSSGAGDGMQKSYEEIQRLLSRLKVGTEGFVFRGSDSFLPAAGQPVESEAARDLVDKAMSRRPDDEPLYVVAIGAITNVASALLMEPRIVERIVVVWLGGQPHYWPSAREFNLAQDVPSSQVVFNSGVPLVQIPCENVASHLLTTVPEVERWVQGRGPIGDYLCEIFKDFTDDHFAWGKVIWDISAPGWLINSKWVPTDVVPSPILTDQVTYSVNRSRHPMRVATQVHRNGIFRDLFTKLREQS